MFAKLSDLLNYLFGIHIDLPIKTYGFFLAVAFVIAGFVLRSELKRKEKENLLHSTKRIISPYKPTGWPEIIFGILISSVLGWKLFGIIIHYREFAADPQQFIFSGKGSLPALLIIAAVSFAYHFYKRSSAIKHADEVQEEIIHPYQNSWNILAIALISAIIGSKIFDILDNFSRFLKNPVHSLLSFSGLTFYGGFIVTVLVLLIYMRVIKLNWKHVIDCAAPAIMIGYAVGRMGCHLSGDGCWGIVNTLPQPDWLSWLPGWLWASDFPHNVINHGVPILDCNGSNCMVLEKPVFPTSLYESIISVFSFGVLWIMRLRIKAPVVLFGLYLVLNGVERFFIEKIRINNKYEFLGFRLTQAEIISALLILIGIAVMIYFTKQYKSPNTIKLTKHKTHKS